MRSRSERRSANEAMKVKARKARPFDPKAERYADHMANCSCVVCGNPRHHRKGNDKLTLQERRRSDAE